MCCEMWTILTSDQCAKYFVTHSLITINIILLCLLFDVSNLKIYGYIAKQLECLPTVSKTMAQYSPKANGWTLTHWPPSSKWGPSGNTGEIKAARKELSSLPHNADGPGQVTSLTGIPQHTDCAWDLP